MSNIILGHDDDMLIKNYEEYAEGFKNYNYRRMHKPTGNSQRFWQILALKFSFFPRFIDGEF